MARKQPSRSIARENTSALMMRKLSTRKKARKRRNTKTDRQRGVLECSFAPEPKTESEFRAIARRAANTCRRLPKATAPGEPRLGAQPGRLCSGMKWITREKIKVDRV